MVNLKQQRVLIIGVAVISIILLTGLLERGRVPINDISKILIIAALTAAGFLVFSENEEKKKSDNHFRERTEMKIRHLIGAGLLVLTAATLIGMVLMDQAYWHIYNYATLLFSVTGAVALFRQK